MTDKFDERFLEQEQQFRQRAFKAHERERELRRTVRQDVDLSDEERMDRYMRGYEGINQQFELAANEHGKWYFGYRATLDETINAGAGEKFSEHLTALASVPDERLGELMKTAQRTGQKDLARAVAQTALERNRFGVFEEWAESDPEVADALKRRRSLPEDKRFRDRTLALRPFKADMPSLTPTVEDRERAASIKAGVEAERRAFFNLPRRQVGSRVS